MTPADGIYTPYRFNQADIALQRVAEAELLITFNGLGYDLVCPEFPELHNLPESVEVLDMMRICWNLKTEFFGRGLKNIYAQVFGEDLPIPSSLTDHWEISNYCDCYMTMKLWEYWEETRRC